MRGYYIKEKPDGETVFICKCCGRSQDFPSPICPDCGNDTTQDSNKGGNI